jgi:hypothetical protein
LGELAKGTFGLVRYFSKYSFKILGKFSIGYIILQGLHNATSEIRDTSSLEGNMGCNDLGGRSGKSNRSDIPKSRGKAKGNELRDNLSYDCQGTKPKVNGTGLTRVRGKDIFIEGRHYRWQHHSPNTVNAKYLSDDGQYGTYSCAKPKAVFQKGLESRGPKNLIAQGQICQ